MSSTRRASRKRVISENENNLDNRQVDENNILYYKRRGEEKPDPIKRLRQMEKLQTDDVKVTCCDFGIDREQLFPNNFSALNVRIGKIVQKRISANTAE